MRRRTPPPLPWRRPRHELALLALVAVAALTPVNIINPQDISRVCLARALVHGHLSADACLGTTLAVDRASYHGHLYSDKAPGVSVLEIPSVEAVGLPPPSIAWPLEYLSLWVVRLFSVGVLFLLAVFLVGRVAEGLAPGYGGLALVSFGLGTLVAPLAATSFDHVPAGAAGFAAFVLAWSRRPALAGLAAGAALLLEYEAAAIVLVVAAYVALQGAWALGKFVYGLLTGAALLWTYDWLAFGAPWRPSYRYVANNLAEQQASGFFGIHLPRAHAIEQVFVGPGGLLAVSSIVLAAAAGLVLLARTHAAEAAVCGLIVLVFLAVNCGYFLPYGGVSPGPRFLVPSLPFLAVGLGPAIARLPRLTAVLAAFSVVPIAVLTLTWGSHFGLAGSPWRALAHPSRLADSLAANVLHWLGTGREFGAIVAGLAALAALVYSSSSIRSAPPATRSPS